MVGGLAMNLFDFQEKAVLHLLDLVADKDCKQTIVMKAPTGAGKTIILIDFVEEYLNRVNSSTAVIWLCPGKGDLEEQSRKKMNKVAPHRKTQDLFEALQNGFDAGSTTFINWELVTKKGNNAIKDGERKNLFDRIRDAHRNNTDFLIIIDEEHSNNTAKAQDIIDSFAATHIIRVSATAIKNNRYEYYEVDELDVIDAGLITKALYVNEGIIDNAEIDNDYDYLIELADKKRQEIDQRYKDVLPVGKTIRPLVLIQFPNGQDKTVQAVETKLESMGYTYDNGTVSKWMSDDKRDLTENLTDNDGIPVFLLMKQAISTGWDCPRAKILVKLREGMEEQFEIQTIGRIRRMPEAKHYDDDLLDFCYVYTFDETYKAGLLSTMDKAYETRRLFLKDKCKTFTLTKQLRDRNFEGLGERDVFLKIYQYLVDKYHLGTDKDDNKTIFAGNGYIFGDEVFGKTLKGQFVKTDLITNEGTYITTRQKADIDGNKLKLLHTYDEIKTAIGMQTAKVRVILERLFKKGSVSKQKILSLETAEYYAFIINNKHRLKEEFRAVTADMSSQLSLVVPKMATFRIPEQDFFKYDPNVRDEVDYLNSAYKEYTSGFAMGVVRSACETMFEQYCEGRSDIDWVYKNGDSGQQYFSIVYQDGLQHQWLFYADYIVKKKNGDVWVIETKGGEFNGEDKNVDIQIGNKFNAFKQYAANNNIYWGFVRYKDTKLYINNTEFAEDMSLEHWRPIADVF